MLVGEWLYVNFLLSDLFIMYFCFICVNVGFLFILEFFVYYYAKNKNVD